MSLIDTAGDHWTSSNKAAPSDVGQEDQQVWDLGTRLFHWINAAGVLVLIGIGLVILNAKALGVSVDGKVLLKTLHVYAGYLYCANLLFRFVWGFIGNRNARWRAILPFGRGYGRALRGEIHDLATGTVTPHAGHGPAARLMVSTMLVLLALQALTGLILAGTDLYMPPVGGAIAGWVAEDNATPQPGSMDGIDVAAYKAMRAYRAPIVTAHEVMFYLLVIAIAAHVIAVVVLEISQRRGLVSAMISGFRPRSD